MLAILCCDALVADEAAFLQHLPKKPPIGAKNEARRRNLVNIDYSIRSGFPFLRRRLMGMLTLFESRQLAVRG